MSLPQPCVLSLSIGDDAVCTSAAVIGKSNQRAAGLAFHFEKQQVWTCPNHCIICAAAGGLSQKFAFFPSAIWWHSHGRGEEQRSILKPWGSAACSSIPSASCHASLCQGLEHRSSRSLLSYQTGLSDPHKPMLGRLFGKLGVDQKQKKLCNL